MKDELIKLLSSHNSADNGIFIPVKLEDYVEKIIENAQIISLSEKGRVIAFIAYYNNDLNKKDAYLTMILVDKEYQSRGIGRNLLEFALKDLKKMKFESFKLEVLKSNQKAISFYKLYGFSIIEDRGDLLLMEMKIQQV
ncbi:MAG: GNAT family N-acetyltransferase [Bacteroidales bacterium]